MPYAVSILDGGMMHRIVRWHITRSIDDTVVIFIASVLPLFCRGSFEAFLGTGIGITNL
jgi:hypothetical protein